MRKTTSVRAFTIMEVTVAMLLTGLVIAITYAMYGIVAKSYSGFGAKNSSVAVVLDLDHVLRRDFERADTILKDSAGISIKIAGEVIKYGFYPEFITRQSSKMDTFKVQTQDWITGFANVPLEELQANSEMNRVDELQFIVVFNNDTIPYHFHKVYSSVNLIKRNADAIH
jgi:hypothetical protein